MKYIIVFLLGVLFWSGCDSVLNTESKPDQIERNTTFEIQIVDETGAAQILYGKNFVPGASVLLKSNTMGTEYNLISDSNGIVTLNGVISDLYLVSVNKQLTPQEMLQVTGKELAFRKLVNSSSGSIQLRADIKSGYQIKLDKIIAESPLVISEIYACGPPGAGLYFHDKYVELFNQSDSTIYLDGIMVAVVYSSSYLGLNYVDDPEYVHSKIVWIFPGEGNDYPMQPGDFVVCAEDAIDHTINADSSVDLSHVSFEFYKDDAPDLDIPDVPNMIKIYQVASHNDWLIGGEKGAIVIAKMNTDSLKWYDDQLLIPYEYILDGVEYIDDPTELDEKILNHSIDAGLTGGIQFYTGKTMERIPIMKNGKKVLKDDNNSSLDFKVYQHPTPEYHNEF